MAKVLIKIFRVHTNPKSPYWRQSDNYSEYIPVPNWDEDNSEKLTISLLNFFRRNRETWINFDTGCQQIFHEENGIIYLTYDDEPNDPDEYLISEEIPIPHGHTLTSICRSYLTKSDAYRELLARDADVLFKTSIPHYCVVAFWKPPHLDEYIYTGHVYTWISPVDVNYCFVMGIRNRMDSTFSPELQLRDVSSYLFEGCRRFALLKGCQHLYVTHPIDTMIPILIKKGFRQDIIEKILYGSSSLGGINEPPPYSTTCHSCYKLMMIDNPLAPIDIVYMYD